MVSVALPEKKFPKTRQVEIKFCRGFAAGQRMDQLRLSRDICESERNVAADGHPHCWDILSAHHRTSDEESGFEGNSFRSENTLEALDSTAFVGQWICRTRC